MHKKQNLIALFMWTTLIIANFNDLYAIHFYGGRPTTLAWTTRRMRNNFTRLKRTNFCEFRFVLRFTLSPCLSHCQFNTQPNGAVRLAATRVRLSIYTLLRWRNIEIVCAAKRREEQRRGKKMKMKKRRKDVPPETRRRLRRQLDS